MLRGLWTYKEELFRWPVSWKALECYLKEMMCELEGLSTKEKGLMDMDNNVVIAAGRRV